MTEIFLKCDIKHTHIPKLTLERTEGTIRNEQSTDTGTLGTKQRQTKAK